ncbi:MAG: NAD(P)/FAD-dependent oxidoreductase [Lachnospiraceae bacterium]|nr:NAD(P)/FAD-dependent oxidoreductase [Lachnospiraceae bacterium]
MRKTIVVGGGAAGMFASVFAAQMGDEVICLEQNEKLGKKLYITGKGRCNFTNAGTMEELFDSIMSNSKFMYSAFYGYNNFDVMDFFEQSGVEYKVERGNRVFPESDHAWDVIDALHEKMRRLGVRIRLNTKVLRLHIDNNQCDGVFMEDEGQKEAFLGADRVIVATGGFSYQTTGSTGDGYRFAKEAGLAVTDLYPSLVPMNTREDYVKELQGLSLRNVSLSIYDEQKMLYSDFGEMLFTHFGITGPLVLTASAMVGPIIKKKAVQGYIDLKPALSEEKLDERILRDFEEGRNKQFKNVIGGLYPAKLTPVMIRLSGINPEKKVNEISREERKNLVAVTKRFPMTITGLRDFKEAIITKGGVSVREVNPKTMESKKIKGLYFAGEVLDVDALTGGFNLQVAWSTAYAAALGE